MRDARDCLSAKTNAYFGFANVADWAYALLITGSGYFLEASVAERQGCAPALTREITVVSDLFPLLYA